MGVIDWIEKQIKQKSVVIELKMLEQKINDFSMFTGEIDEAIKFAKENSMEDRIPSIWERAANKSYNKREKEIRFQAAAIYARQLGMIDDAERYEKRYQNIAGEEIDYDNIVDILLYGPIPEKYKKNYSN